MKTVSDFFGQGIKLHPADDRKAMEGISGGKIVVYLTPFFGKYVPEIGIGYYNEEQGWISWEREQPISVVAWATIDAESLFLKKSDQREFDKHYGDRSLEEFDGTVPASELIIK